MMLTLLPQLLSYHQLEEIGGTGRDQAIFYPFWFFLFPHRDEFVGEQFGKIAKDWDDNKKRPDVFTIESAGKNQAQGFMIKSIRLFLRHILARIDQLDGNSKNNDFREL